MVLLAGDYCVQEYLTFDIEQGFFFFKCALFVAGLAEGLVCVMPHLNCFA